MNSFLLFLFFSSFRFVAPRVCEVGYGQRGFKHSDAIVWQRNCKKSDYCFEAVTTDIRKMRPIIDYPWGAYYREYFIKGCGGDLGMDTLLNIDVPVPKTVDLIFDRTITTDGGTVEFNLKYRCMKDLCSGASPLARSSELAAMLAVAVLTSVLMFV